jgi:hypothetical protein
VNERALENWLDNANERAFQIPFCHALAAEGYQVVHMSRHCAMEMGKDILAIDPKGDPCAFQLKNISGKQLTLSKWRDGLERQVVALVHNKIVHPSIPTNKSHRSFIVLNGELSEEVARSIDDFNRGLKGKPKVTAIVRGQLLDKFKKLGTDFWPSEISAEFKLFLELLLTNGRENLPKAKFAQLLESALQLEGKVPKATFAVQTRRVIATAILCSYAIAPFQKCENHLAEFEAWTMLFSHLLAFAEKNKLSPKVWHPTVVLVSDSMFNALGRLCDETSKRKKLVEGDILADRHVYPVRVTALSGLFSLYAMWRWSRDIESDETDNSLREFVLEHSNRLWLWGEAAAPQFLAAIFYQRRVDASLATEGTIGTLIRLICHWNHPRAEKGLPSPYYDADQVLLHLLGDEENRIKERFVGSSHSLQSFWHLLVRCNLKLTAKLLWPDVSRIAFVKFQPAAPWRFFQWRARKGLNTILLQKPTQRWPELVAEADDVSGRELPRSLRQFPVECLAFLFVYPHRLTASAVRWLDDNLWNLGDKKSKSATPSKPSKPQTQ